MAKRKYRFVLRKASPLVKTVILIAIVLSTIALVTLHATIQQTRQEYEQLRQEAGVLEENNEGLLERIENLGSLESIIQIAMEKLGLVMPDTTIFDTD